MKAVHFGAGNIGRGFIGLQLHDAGYEVVFADVDAALIDALAASDHYTVHEVGEGARDLIVDDYRAINSQADAASLSRFAKVAMLPAAIVRSAACSLCAGKADGGGFPMGMTGRVKFFNGERGYGLIKPDDGGRDVFVHITAVERAGLKDLAEGQRISFEVEPDKKGKGPKAVNLVISP